jgi:hypothetical protein
VPIPDFRNSTMLSNGPVGRTKTVASMGRSTKMILSPAFSSG